MNREELREKQFEIVREGLREAAKILLEMDMALEQLEEPEYESIDESIEQVDEVSEQYSDVDEIEFDMSEIEEELVELQESDVYEVNDDMIIGMEEFPNEETLSPLIKLENFLAKVQKRKLQLSDIKKK